MDEIKEALKRLMAERGALKYYEAMLKQGYPPEKAKVWAERWKVARLRLDKPER